MDVLCLSHVTLRYDSGAQALEDVSIRVARGERVCILGANGSGKSTLASVLCGLLAPDEGRVTLLGETVFDAGRGDPIDFDAYQRARRSLGLVFQNPDDQIVTTVVEEDVAFGPENLCLAPDEIGRRVERELRRVALTDYAKADPTRLSGGQKQRVAIAGALAMEPQVIVFDEPGALLDVRGRTSIMRVMRRLSEEGTTIVHITHFMEEALEADRVLVMDHGHVVLEGTPQDVFAHAEQIASLGLEEPFAARLSRRLSLPWTCDDDELLQAIVGRLERGEAARDAGSREVATSLSASTLPASDALATNPVSVAKSAAVYASDAPGPHAPIAIQSDHVSFAYRNERKALDDVTFAIAQGTSTAIVGQTGSGKSTLLRLVCALEVPDEGTITVDGVCTQRKRDRRRLHGRIGYVMQHPERQLFAETVIQDVAFGPTNLGLSREEVERRCHHALNLVGLVGFDDASPFELSGGQQRLCAIAGVLAMEPSILVLDEPTAGLDPRGRRELRSVLEDIHAHGVTIVQVTHSMEDAVRTQQVVALNQSHVMLMGRPREVFAEKNAPQLQGAGLGMPLPLAWAMRLAEAGTPALGQPITLEELAASIEGAWGKEG